MYTLLKHYKDKLQHCVNTYNPYMPLGGNSVPHKYKCVLFFTMVENIYNSITNGLSLFQGEAGKPGKAGERGPAGPQVG